MKPIMRGLQSIGSPTPGDPRARGQRPADACRKPGSSASARGPAAPHRSAPRKDSPCRCAASRPSSASAAECRRRGTTSAASSRIATEDSTTTAPGSGSTHSAGRCGTCCRRRAAEGLDRGDEIPLPQRKHLRPGHAREGRDAGDADRDQRRRLAAPEHRDQRHGEQDAGQRQQQVDDAHQQRVAPAAEEPGNQSDRHADRGRDHDRARSGQRATCARHRDAGQDVPAELVGAEPDSRREGPPASARHPASSGSRPSAPAKSREQREHTRNVRR